MSTTRHAAPGSALSTERGLSSPKLAGINIGLNVVIRVAQAHNERCRRAMIWLVNYATNVKRLTADAMSEELGMEKGKIRSALTDPECEHVEDFADKVQIMREAFEATIPDMVDTEVNREVTAALRFALKKTKMAEIIGKTRMGKSECARTTWLRNLDRMAWYECPEDDTERGFFYELAGMLGIGVSSAKKTGLFRAQCKTCFGPNGITVLIVDEAHRLWPADVRAKPKRVEFERAIYADGRGCSVVNIATPQHSMSLNASLDKAGRWAPGQYEGRICRFHLEDTMSIADLSAVARHHAPEADAQTINALVEQALSSQGYCGAMVETIDMARLLYDAVTLQTVTKAQLKQIRGTQMEADAKAMANKKGLRLAA